MNERISSEGYTMPDFTEEYLRRLGMDKSTVDVFDLCRKEGIALLRWSEPEVRELARVLGFDRFMENGNDGFTYHNSRGRKVIFYDDRRLPERQRTTVAHELGHFELGHATGNCPPCKGHRCDECREWQADSFALNLLF